MCKNVVIIGAGGHAKVIADIVKKSGDNLLGFLDDSKEAGSEVLDAFVLGGVDSFLEYADAYLIIGIGNPKVRETISQKLTGCQLYTAIHPTAVIGEGVRIGEGTCVMANAVINPDAVVGKYCIINTAAIVEHDNRLADFVHVSPGAALAGTVTVGERTHIGIGANVKNNTAICADVVVGAGGVVIRDITEEGTYVGVPVRKVQ